MKKVLQISLFLFACVSTFESSAQWNPSAGWRDSYQANGLCWCDSSNFDHGLDSKTVTINGTAYSVEDICDELQNHPLFRARQTGDPVYNDIQCGNGPFNDAPDEPGCPGRVDLGSGGCSELGAAWDMDWLENRPRFAGDGCTVFQLPQQIQAEDFCAQFGTQTINASDVDGSQKVGYIGNGDWLEYPIHIPASSTYTIEIRVASASAGGDIGFELSGTNVGSMAVSNTGGWESWETITQSLYLPSGTHTLRFAFTGSGSSLMDMNWINIYSSDVIIQSKVLLGGAWNGSMMGTTLNTILPTEDPYGLGETTNGIPYGAVDWVKVELRSTTNTILAERACFVDKDGMLIDLDGKEGVRFSGISGSEAYIVIRHRNHLGVMSGAKLSF